MIPIPNFQNCDFLSGPIFWNRNQYFSSETKFSETKTETFFRDQIFLKPILFFQYQIFRNRNWNFFLRSNFSGTETDTFFPRPNFTKLTPKPSKNWQKSQDRDRNFSISLQIFGVIFSKYFPPFPSLVCFYSPPEKKIFSFSEYFHPFSSPPTSTSTSMSTSTST